MRWTKHSKNKYIAVTNDSRIVISKLECDNWQVTFYTNSVSNVCDTLFKNSTNAKKYVNNLLKQTG